MRYCVKYGLVLLWSIVSMLYFSGCINTDSGSVDPVDLRTATKFVNLSNLGTMNVIVDGGSLAQVGYGGASDYLSLATGTRTFNFVYDSKVDTLITALAHDTKYSVFSVFEPLNGDTACWYNFAFERRTYPGTQTFVPQAALVRFIHLSRDTAAASVTFKLIDTVSATADVIQSALTFGTATSYFQASLAHLPRFLVYNRYGDTLAAPVALSEGRFSVVLFGNKLGSTLQVQVFQED